MNNKGVSTLVTTIIIVLLVFVVTTIIWFVIQGLVQGNADDVLLGQRCLDVNVAVTALSYQSGFNYSITLKRSSTGEEVEGVKLVFFNDEDASEVIDFAENISPLETLKRSIDAGILNATKVEITPYFKDESDNEQLCLNTASYEF